MTNEEIKRLGAIEKRVHEICEENGLETTTINFEIVSAERMIEALAYRLPTNFSHWSFGRDYEMQETQYRHSGEGIPYEVVWNFDHPTALLVDTNPFALNVLILAHVYGHVDFDLANIFMRRGRKITDVISEARCAKQRFLEYEKLYGAEEVEKIIDATFSWQLHQNLDTFADPIPEDELRERRLAEQREKLAGFKNDLSMAGTKDEAEEIKSKITKTEKVIRHYETATPPEPEYDILKYLIERSPKVKKDWVKDVVSVVREQIRALLVGANTKLMNEGWATYWHTQILRQLTREGVITSAECEQAIYFHAKVTQNHRIGFNVYCIGPAFWERIEERWNKGQFGPEWEKCNDRYEKDGWDKKLGLGRKKMLEFRRILSDKMAVENYFDDDFIHGAGIYIWQSEIDPDTGEEVYFIAEDRPEVIRKILSAYFTGMRIPIVSVADGNFGSNGELLLIHDFSGFELDPKYESGALEKLYFLWGKTVHLITYEVVDYDEEKGQFKLKKLIHSYGSSGHKFMDIG